MKERQDKASLVLGTCGDRLLIAHPETNELTFVSAAEVAVGQVYLTDDQRGWWKFISG